MEKTENSKSNNSKRRLSIAAALLLVVAVICGGGLWWHRNAVQEHDRAFASYKTAGKNLQGSGGRISQIPGIRRGEVRFGRYG